MTEPAERLAERTEDTAHLPMVPGGEGCLEILSDRLRMSPGVVAIEADFASGQLTVRYEPSQVTTDELNALADEVGVLFAQRVTSCEKRGAPGACEECALRLGHVIDDGLRVVAEPGRVGISRVHVPESSLELVRPLSSAKPWGAKLSAAEQEHFSKNRAMALLTGVCLALLVAGFLLDRGAQHAAATTVYTLAALAGGWFTLRSTARSLAKMRFDVNLLMLLAALGAAIIGYVAEAATLMFLFSLSNTLEVYTMGRTRRALHALLRLRPTRALVIRNGAEIEIEADEVRVGERVVVKPGASFAVDGLVLTGESTVDQSNLTGESVPVPKVRGDKVYAGTLNQGGALEVRTTRAAGDTALARVVALVTEAQEQKSRTEEVAEWVGRYYTIAVMVGVGLMIVIPPFVLGHPFASSFYRAMTLLVVASPCALVIATPATVLSAIANAARNGVLFKGGRFLEVMGRVKAIAFDKTGTLTHGRFEVTDVVGLDGARDLDVLAWAAAAEKRSPHPLAQSVVREAERRGLDVAPATELVSHVGKGLVAKVDGQVVEVGTPELFQQLGVAVPPSGLEKLRLLRDQARTAMLVRNGGSWGVIAAADQVRPVAAKTVASLRALGIRRIVLISGDNPHTVEAIAKLTGMDQHRGGLLPEDKVGFVAELEKEHGTVAMVGDGVNDAPALARASVGVAMGGIGSDAAMESADVVLMGDDLTALPYALRLSQKARSIVRQNVTIAVGVMGLLVIWVFLGQHTPFGALRLPVAVSGHEGSTVVVILNGLRLLAERRAR